MVGVADDEWYDGGGFGVYHLFVEGVDFSPRGGFFEGRAGAGAVAGVGHGNLDGVLVHRHVVAEAFGAYDGVLRKVFGRAAANHEESACLGGEFNLRQFAEVGYRINGEEGFFRFDTFRLVHDQSEAGAAIGECGYEDGHVMFVASLYQGIFFHGVLGEPVSGFPEEFAGGVGTGFEGVGNGFDGAVAVLQFVFVDKGIVDSVDIVFTELFIVDEWCAFVVFVAERLEEVHVDDGRAGGHYAIDHIKAYHIDVDLHTAAGAGAACQDEPVGAAVVVDHPLQDVGGNGRVARGEGHFPHGVDNCRRINFRNIHMPDYVF